MSNKDQWNTLAGGLLKPLRTTLGVRFGREPKCLYSRQPWVFGSDENQNDYILEASGCSVRKQPSCVRGRKEFGSGEKCVRRKTVIPRTICVM